jgi:predicted dehydrogenase
MRIGLMSFAHLHAEAYIQNLRAIPGVEVIGLADEEAGRGRHFANQFQARYFSSYAELLAEKPDGVLVCSENAKHRPLIELAAAAGAHILSEKPLATTLADAQAMLDACQKAGVILMTAFPMRFSPPLIEVKSTLAGGGLGQLYSCAATNQGELPRHHREWFVDPDLAGGGAVMDHTVHLADILRWYLESEVVELFAQTNQIIQGDTVRVETGGLLLLTFANGVFATIDCSWSRPKTYPTWGGLTLELVGERGVLNVDAFKQTYTLYGRDNAKPTWGFWGSDVNQAMIEEFVAAIREKRPPKVSGYDGYKALEIALAAYQSAQTGQPVRLPV